MFGASRYSCKMLIGAPRQQLAIAAENGTTAFPYFFSRSGGSSLSRRLETPFRLLTGAFWRVVDEQMYGVDFPFPRYYLGFAGRTNLLEVHSETP